MESDDVAVRFVVVAIGIEIGIEIDTDDWMVCSENVNARVCSFFLFMYLFRF